jgi:hypothetical protein
MKKLFLLLLSCTLTFTACDKEAPTAEFDLYSGHSFSADGPGIVPEGGTFACCYDAYIRYKNVDAFRFETRYLCSGAVVSTAKSYLPQDTVWWTREQDIWIEVTAWDSNGNKDVKRKHYHVQ